MNRRNKNINKNAEGREEEGAAGAGPSHEPTEAEIFGTLPGGGRRASLQRTPPTVHGGGEASEVRKESVMGTPLTEFSDFAAAQTESDASEKENKGAIKKLQMRPRKKQSGLPRVATPVPRQGQAMSLVPVLMRVGELAPPPPKEDSGASNVAGPTVPTDTEKEEGSSDSVSIISDGDFADVESVISGVHPLKKRKRGRPETTGQYAILKQRRKEEEALAVAERERREEAQILDENLPLKYSKNLPTVEDIMEDMSHLPTPDITAETMRHVDGVARVALVSSKMKGTVKKALNEAALNARAALTTLAIRAQKLESDAASSQEIESLRRQVRMLKADNARLTAEGESARSSLQRMEREVEALRNSLKELKEGMREDASPPTRRRRKESPPRRLSDGRGGSRSAPVLLMDAPLPTEHDAGAFLLQQMEETLERLLSQKFRSLMEPMGEQPLPTPRKTPPQPIAEGCCTGERENIMADGDVEPPPIQPTIYLRPPPSSRKRKNKGGGKERREEEKPRETGPPSAQPPSRRGVPKGEEVAARGQPSPPQGKKGDAAVKRPPPSEGRGGRNAAFKQPPPSGRRGRGAIARGQPPPPRGDDGERGIPTYPPSQLPPPTEPWSTVVGRREKKGVGNPGKGNAGKGMPAGGSGAPPAGRREAPPPTEQGAKKGGRRKLPTTAAVTIAAKNGGYGDIIKTARKILGESALRDIGIMELRTRKAITGAYILEIPGGNREEREAKAEALATKLEAIFGDRDDIKIACPLKMAQIRVRDLDESVDKEDIVQALVKIGGSNPQNIKVGRIAFAPNGMGAAIVQCPLAVANKAAAGGRITVGWAACRVNLLEARPLQCFKCLGLGHVQTRCPSTLDRSKCCYRCGVEGHLAADCRASPKCVVCTQMGRPANHRTGARCGSQPPKPASRAVEGKGRRKPPPPLKSVEDPAPVSAALGPMGGRFSPSKERTPPVQGRDVEEAASMETGSPSPSLPQRRLRSRRRIAMEVSPEAASPGGDQAPPEVEQPPAEWPREGAVGWSDGEGRGGDEPPPEEPLIILG